MILDILLFLISFLCVAVSSFLISSVFQSKKTYISFLFVLLLIPAQVIFSFEILSVFKAITKNNFFILNIIFLIISVPFWKLSGKHLLSPNFFGALNKISLALKQDKLLFYLGIFFIFATLTSLFLAVYAPVNQWDSTTYHVARVWFWIQNATLNHFESSSIRQLMFPPNSELLILWPIIFIKKDFLNGFGQFYSYIASIFSLYCFLSYLKLSTRRILWTIFVFASLPAIILQASSSQNDLNLGFYLLSAVFLFLVGIREKEKSCLIFSALALGISAGVKASVFYYLPAMAVVMTIISIIENKRKFYEPILKYFILSALFFGIFSSYFYIQNLNTFGHPIGLSSYIDEHLVNEHGIKLFIANVIRYLYSYIDATGMEFLSFLSFPLYTFKYVIFKTFGISETIGLIEPDINLHILVNTKIHENLATFGLIGFLVYLPLLYKTAKTSFSHKRTRLFYISLTALIAVIFIITISALMGYKVFNNRYLTTAMVISAPVFALSYSKKQSFIKFLIFTISVFYFIKIPLFNDLRRIAPVRKANFIENSRECIKYNSFKEYDTKYREPAEYLSKVAPNDSNIVLFFTNDEWYEHFFAKNPSLKIFPYRYDLFKYKDMNNYDYLVFSEEEQGVYNPYSAKPHKIFIKYNFNEIKKEFKHVFTSETLIYNVVDEDLKKYKYRIFKRK